MSTGTGLLFDLTDQRIWSRSMSDSLGLYTHFEANKEDYRWDVASIHHLRLRLKEDRQKGAEKVLKGTGRQPAAGQVQREECLEPSDR